LIGRLGISRKNKDVLARKMNIKNWKKYF